MLIDREFSWVVLLNVFFVSLSLSLSFSVTYLHELPRKTPSRLLQWGKGTHDVFILQALDSTCHFLIYNSNNPPYFFFSSSFQSGLISIFSSSLLPSLRHFAFRFFIVENTFMKFSTDRQYFCSLSSFFFYGRYTTIYNVCFLVFLLIGIGSLKKGEGWIKNQLATSLGRCRCIARLRQ